MTGLRERNRTEQRQRIQDAAFALFAERGFEEVTVAEIADAAGVARATVFNHFASKRGLVEAITEQVLVFYQEMLDRALATHGVPTPVLLRALFEQMGAGIEGFRRFQRGVFREIARLQVGLDEGGPAQRVNEENQARLRELFARGQAQSELAREHTPEALASAFSILANGTITAWLFADTDESLRLRMREAVRIFLAPVAEADDPTRPLPDLTPARLGSNSPWPPLSTNPSTP
jgi:AcrR family transcriptional regulator